MAVSHPGGWAGGLAVDGVRGSRVVMKTGERGAQRRRQTRRLAVGAETIAAALADQRDVIEEVIEPYLIQQGLLQRTPRGRMLTHHAYAYLGLPVAAARLAQLDLLAAHDPEAPLDEAAS